MKSITKEKIEELKKAFYQAEHDKSNLREFDRDLYGASGHKIKHLINNLASTVSNSTFLEFGIYRGSTMVAALYETKVKKWYGIDDFTLDYKEADFYKKSGWSNARATANELLAIRYSDIRIDPKREIVIIEKEAKLVDITDLPKTVDFIHYDLDTHHATVESILRMYLKIFDTYTVLIVANWNAKGVRASFSNFQKTPGLIFTDLGHKQSRNTADNENWYNGVSLWLVEKELD